MASARAGAVSEQLQSLFRFGTTIGLSDGKLLERFLEQRDEAGQEAFRALVKRHAPMVLRLCHNVLHDWHEAEDASQATFLVLASKAGSIRKRDSIASWLFAVACRVASQTRARALRMRAHEKHCAKPIAQADLNVPWLELYEEIDRLPEHWRSPLVLCYLRGHSQEEAAARLGCPIRTLQRRLSQGQDRLRTRLTRRGLFPSAGLLWTSNDSSRASITVPSAWLEMTVRAALATVEHATTAGVVSAASMELTREVLKIMLLHKLKLVSVALFAVIVMAWGGAAALIARGHEPLASRTLQTTPEQQAGQPTPEKKKEPALTVRGRVLGPDGWPFAGAKLLTSGIDYSMPPFSTTEYAATGPGGRFEFTVPKGKFNAYSITVAAVATNLGVGWVNVPQDSKTDDLTLQLVDDEPITGQIIDLEGRPVQGATLRVLQIRATAREDLGPWLEAGKGKTGLRRSIGLQFFPRVTSATAMKVTTDAEGRFRLTGIGRNRLVMAQLDGPSIVSEYLNFLSRPGEAIGVLLSKSPRVVATYYGASFQHVAAPAKPIVGVVRDKDTKKPLAGITIRSYKLANSPDRNVDIVRTTTDAQGRYRLIGMPKGTGNRIMIVPGSDLPYLISYKDLPDSPGLGPVTVDLDLKRGIWIEGKITDKETGTPLQGRVSSFAQPNNPNLQDYILSGIVYRDAESNKDGSYRVAAMPGPGFITASAGNYLLAIHRNDEFAVKELVIPTVGQGMHNFCAVARIDPSKNAESVKRDVTLDPGWTLNGTVLGPDGQPLAGAWNIGLDNSTIPWDRPETMTTAYFTVSKVNPLSPRELLFQHTTKKLVGVARLPKGRDDSIIVRMQPGATVTGRLVDTNGEPRAGVEMELWFRSNVGANLRTWGHYFPREPIKTDQQGRFRIEALLPSYRFRLTVGKGELRFGYGLGSSQTMDLGDVKIEAQRP